MIELRSHSVEDTRAIAGVIAGLVGAGDLIVLAGEMGAGKTAFAQGFAKSLGINDPVTSPTYTLVHTYEPAGTEHGLISRLREISHSNTVNSRTTHSTTNSNTITVHHVDLYRLEHTGEVEDLALDELLEDNSVMLVEWGDMVDLGPHLQVAIRVTGAQDATDARDIVVTASDKRWSTRWDRLVAELEAWSA